jgi:hypothetical protein
MTDKCARRESDARYAPISRRRGARQPSADQVADDADGAAKKSQGMIELAVWE